MAGIGTRVWSTERVGTRLTAVQAAKQEIEKYIDLAKDSNRDGRVNAHELKRALREAGAPAAAWSAVMGTLASTIGSVHNDPTKERLKATLDQALTIVSKANATDLDTLEFGELRTIKKPIAARLIDFGNFLEPRPSR
jgi:hypothetical protein